MRAGRDLTDYIGIQSRFLRSMNLEHDYTTHAADGEYVVTANARAALHRVSEGLADGSPSRAWTITGPYGAGKTAFAVFLTRLLCLENGEGGQAREQLTQADPELAEAIREAGVWRNGHRGMLPILVTARRAPASVCLLQALITAVGTLPNAASRPLVRRLSSMLKSRAAGGSLDSRELAQAVSRVADAATNTGHWGALLVFDELGKLLEYAARDPRSGDVYVLQELAELASRSPESPLLMLGFLHQSFAEYGRHLDSATRREWEKIGGRFGDVPFIEPPDQVIRMVASAIKPTDRPLPAPTRKRVRQIAAEAAQALCPPGMKPEDFQDAAVRSYPLHPVALAALPYLFKRFAQNERSLFAYLSSQEPLGFQDFLRTHSTGGNEPAFLRLPDLFDYFVANFGIALYRHPHAKRWLEAADILDTRSELTELHAALIKSTGILNALGEFSHLNAHEDVLALSLVDSPAPTGALSEAIAVLREQSVITFVAFNNTFRIWEGSDVDLEERIAQGSRVTRGDLSLASSIQRYLPPRPLVARRHSFETGTPRFFSVAYVDDPDELTPEWKAAPDGDAHVAVCLASSAADHERFVQAAMGAIADRSDLVVALPQEIGELRAAVGELGALRWAWDNTPELRDDRVARREISLRIGEAEQQLLRNLGGLLDPRPRPIGSACLWFSEGQKATAETPVKVSHLLSSVCGRLYPDAPIIRNELISRRSLSSAAAAARRKLIEAMLDFPGEPLLGIVGYPPERSIYESVLRATGLHCQDEAGEWGFGAPQADDGCNIGPCWRHLCDRILTDQMEPVAVSDLFAELSAPPFGIPDGLHPVLLCAFLAAHSNEATLYREGTFVPEVDVADFEVLMRRPELYSVAGGRVSGVRAAVVNRLARGLKVEAATVPVVRSLFSIVRRLPDFARQTKRLPERTLALRATFSDAVSPERFLFVDLPQALGFEPFADCEMRSDDIEPFFESLNANLQHWADAAPSNLRWARDQLLSAFGLDEGEHGWEQLRREAADLAPVVIEPQLGALLERVREAEPGEEGVESVLALVAARPPHSWRDEDRDGFPETARKLGRSFRRALEAHRSSGSAGLSDRQLTSSQEREANVLSGAIEEFLLTQIASPSPRVLRAALLLLAQRVGGDEHDG